MIVSNSEYQSVHRQAEELWNWWSRIEKDGDPLTVSNIHRRLAKLHQEMAEYKTRIVQEQQSVVNSEL